MSPIEAVISRMKNMIKNVDKITVEEIKKESEMISKLNREQLMRGVDAFGAPTPNYADSNKKSGRMNFFDTGDFQEAIKPFFDNSGIDIESRDFKNAFLNPYKRAIETLGLTEDSVRKLQLVVLPRIITRLKNI